MTLFKALILILHFALAPLTILNVHAWDGATGAEEADFLGFNPKTHSAYFEKRVTFDGGYFDHNGKRFEKGWTEINLKERFIYEIDRNGKTSQIYCSVCEPNIYDYIHHNDILSEFSILPKKAKKISSKDLEKLITSLKKVAADIQPSESCIFEIRLSQLYNVAYENMAEYWIKPQNGQTPWMLEKTRFTGCLGGFPEVSAFWIPDVNAAFIVEKNRKLWIPGSSCSWLSEKVVFYYDDRLRECFKKSEK